MLTSLFLKPQAQMFAFSFQKRIWNSRNLFCPTEQICDKNGGIGGISIFFRENRSKLKKRLISDFREGNFYELGKRQTSNSIRT